MAFTFTTLMHPSCISYVISLPLFSLMTSDIIIAKTSDGGFFRREILHLYVSLSLPTVWFAGYVILELSAFQDLIKIFKLQICCFFCDDYSHAHDRSAKFTRWSRNRPFSAINSLPQEIGIPSNMRSSYTCHRWYKCLPQHQVFFKKFQAYRLRKHIASWNTRNFSW